MDLDLDSRFDVTSTQIDVIEQCYPGVLVDFDRAEKAARITEKLVEEKKIVVNTNMDFIDIVNIITGVL